MKANPHARREATQLFRLCLVQGVVDETRAREVVNQLVTAKRRGYLGVLSHFRRLLQLDVARRTARVTSARALPADLQGNVRTRLTGVYGSALTASFAEDASLIGGMRIQVGSDVYDGSLKARLAALEQSF